MSSQTPPRQIKYVSHVRRSFLFFPQHRLWVSLTVRASVFVSHCWFYSFRTPRIRRRLLLYLLLLFGPLPITDFINMIIILSILSYFRMKKSWIRSTESCLRMKTSWIRSTESCFRTKKSWFRSKFHAFERKSLEFEANWFPSMLIHVSMKYLIIQINIDYWKKELIHVMKM